MHPVTIDGYTQPGASPNTLTVGDNAVLLIKIDSSNLGFTATFHLEDFDFHGSNSDGSTIKGLVMDNGNGAVDYIYIQGANNCMVVGNFLGIEPDGSTPLGGARPVNIEPLQEHLATGNVIGGTNPADRNIIVAPQPRNSHQR